MDFPYRPAPRRAVRWDIQVNADFQENSVEYNHAFGVVIRANCIEFALGLIARGRELVEEYPDNTG